MKASNNAIELIKRFEGCSLTAYKCSAGVCTIGYGHTQNVKITDTITYEEAEELLYQDIKVAEKAIKNFVKVPLNQNQYDALVSFIFNVGSNNFKTSTLLKLINDNKIDEAALQFSKWVYAGKKVLEGLKKRRIEETKLFVTKEKKTMYGIDYLGGATYEKVILQNHPKGWGAGFFLNTFGNAWKVIKKLAESGLCPLIRVHAVWDDLHQYKAGHLDLIKKELKKCCNVSKKYPSVKFEFSPFCEHNFTSQQSDEVFTTCKKIIEKQQAKIKLVNCVWQGKFILDDADIINECHGSHKKPKRGAYNYSFDGLDAYNANTQMIKDCYNDAETFFFWTISLNLKRDEDERISIAKRIERSYRPQGVHIKALEALAPNKGKDNVPSTWIVKPMSEDCSDLKSNKLLVLIPHKSDNVKLVRNNAKNTVIETLKRFDPPVGSLYRYYASKAGYEFVKKNLCKIEFNGKIQKSGGVDILFNPAFRAGTYRT